MNIAIQYILGIIVITFTNIYSWCKILNKKVDFKSKKLYIIFILMAATTIANYFYINQFIKVLTIILFMAVFIVILFKEKINHAILLSVIVQLLYMIAEFIFAFGLVYIFKANPDDFVSLYFAKFLTNFIISIIVIILVQFKFIRKLYEFLLKITNMIKLNTLMMMLLIVMIAINIFVMTLYYDLNFTYIMIFNTVLTIICFIIVINSIYNKNNYIKVSDKYNSTLNSLKEYEDILDKYRISNHENKNQLLTIRNMLPKSNKKTIEYIDTIVENKLKDNDKIMAEASKIPAGGLRGLIYSKLLLMKDKKINYSLDISKDIKTADLINKIDDSTMWNICKIIGVYLDNSIQAVEKLKRKHVSVEMFLENNFLIISISNNYEGIIEIEKLENKGYTSKGKGHGYGLTLAKQIIENNKRLSNEKSISKDIFTQTLKIKM